MNLFFFLFLHTLESCFAIPFMQFLDSELKTFERVTSSMSFDFREIMFNILALIF